jgi:hypothetical protein
MNCLQCGNKSDPELRVYRNNETKEVYRGQRNFCSDACECAYHTKMDELYPSMKNLFERLL